ncbi:MAG: M1 family metallopeptidase, partial [bacterium]|nr:M1 family metallopeptidase [bacterium]
IVPYMVSDRRVPIMTNSESLLQFGNNAYAKPATALNILRESILGRELFDHAFREYARRWMFKRPEPADLFRSLEDASGIDLDWFWRGWFYGTDHVDVAIDKVTLYQLDSRDPDVEKPRLRAEDEAEPETLTELGNAGLERRLDRYPELADFYNSYDEFDVTPYDYAQYRKFLEDLEDREKVLLATGEKFYVVDFLNVGGLPMPLPLEITYGDGSARKLTIPAEIWRHNAKKVSKLFITEKEIVKIVLDPHLSIADADRTNNHFPPEVVKSRFQLFKIKEEPNPMLRDKENGGGTR